MVASDLRETETGEQRTSTRDIRTSIEQQTPQQEGNIETPSQQQASEGTPMSLNEIYNEQDFEEIPTSEPQSNSEHVVNFGEMMRQFQDLQQKFNALTSPSPIFVRF
eukprot:NODE_833_length_3618_cov_0.950270.p5 type:complete len:107 gc:universal NODE_833_length_3618_cov_0.950270:443-123(-)